MLFLVNSYLLQLLGWAELHRNVKNWQISRLSYMCKSSNFYASHSTWPKNIWWKLWLNVFSDSYPIWTDSGVSDIEQTPCWSELQRSEQERACRTDTHRELMRISCWEDGSPWRPDVGILAGEQRGCAVALLTPHSKRSCLCGSCYWVWKTCRVLSECLLQALTLFLCLVEATKCPEFVVVVQQSPPHVQLSSGRGWWKERFLINHFDSKFTLPAYYVMFFSFCHFHFNLAVDNTVCLGFVSVKF